MNEAGPRRRHKKSERRVIGHPGTDFETLSAGANFGVQLIGTEGIIDLRVDREPLVQVMQGSPFLPKADPRTWVPISSGGVGKPDLDPKTGSLVAGHILAGRDLIAAINEKRPTLCNAEDGRTIVEMICAVFQSHVENGARVTLPLKNRENPLATWR